MTAATSISARRGVILSVVALLAASIWLARRGNAGAVVATCRGGAESSEREAPNLDGSDDPKSASGWTAKGKASLEGAMHETTTESLVARLSSPSRQSNEDIAADGIPIMQAKNDSSSLGPRHPHPITLEHLRIFRENSLLGSMDGAVDVADSAAIRRLNGQYRREYPGDEHRMQSGYELIADCLERPSATTRSRAERYFAEERGSTLRRYVKRHCLDATASQVPTFAQ